jgi:hypothetical protein
MQNPRIIRLDPKNAGHPWRAHPFSDRAVSIFGPINCTLDIDIYPHGISIEASANPIRVRVTAGRILVVLGRVFLANPDVNVPMVIWRAFAAEMIHPTYFATPEIADFMKAGRNIDAFREQEHRKALDS